MAQVKGKITVKNMKNMLDAYKTVTGNTYTEKKLYASYILKNGCGKMSATLHIFETTCKENGLYTYWIIMENNTVFYFMGTTKEELEHDLERFTGITKSDKEYHMKEWGMTEDAWNEWNGIGTEEE